MEREVGGGIGMGNTCKPMAVSFQCMTKFTINKKKKSQVSGDQKKKKIQAVLIVPDLIEEMPQPCYTKEIGVKIGG